MTTPLAGEIIYADDVASLVKAGTIIARATRGTSSTPAGATPQGVLRLDDVPVKAGRLYWVGTGTCLLLSTVSTDRASARLSITVDGSTPTTSSSLFAIANTPVLGSTGDGMGVVVGNYYVPASNLNLSVLLFTSRAAGTGNVSIFVTQSINISLMVVDLGADPGTGFATII